MELLLHAIQAAHFGLPRKRRKQKERLCPDTAVGGGQSRFSCGKGTGYSGRLTEMASSSSWACSMMPGASSNQEAELHLYDILYRQS